MATHAVKNFIRNRDFFKIASCVETGAEHGMWTFQRYRTWLDNRTNWYLPGQSAESPDTDAPETLPASVPLPAFTTVTKPGPSGKKSAPAPLSSSPAPGRIEIEPVESEFGKILKRPGE
jgi:twitching motility protein PilT